MTSLLTRFWLFDRIGLWLVFFRRLFRVVAPYWNGENRWRVRGMTGALLALTILQIAVATSINAWIEKLFDSLEHRDMNRFLILVGVAALIIVANIAVTIFHLAAKRWIQIGWRQWLTHRLLGEWMTDSLHYRVALFPGEHTNPDGRIAEDIRFTTENAIELAHSLLYAFLIFISFTTILWGLSGVLKLDVAGHSIALPGHLVLIAVIYAAIGTLVAMWLGIPLIKAQNFRQTTEADFRFGLAHTRENSLHVALLRGEGSEERHLRTLFLGAMQSWNLQTRALVGLFYFSSAWWVLSQVFPILVASPRYLAGAITLGILMQTAQAFQQTVGAMSWPVDNVSKLADWRASAERVLDLHDALGVVKRGEVPASGDTIRIQTGLEAKLALNDLVLTEQDGTPIIAPFSTEVLSGQRIQIATDALTALKMMRAMAQLWPWGHGHIVLPRNGPIFFDSQRPYLPRGLLRAMIVYPQAQEQFADTAIAGALDRVGLAHLAGDLDRHAHWDEVLPEDDRYRIAFARILLFRPDWVVFQETFDVLTPATRAAMLRVLATECPQTAIVVIGPTPALDGFSVHRVAAAGSR